MSSNSSIRIIVQTAKTELVSLFGSPIAWAILLLFSIRTGSDFLGIFCSEVSIVDSAGGSLLPLSSIIYLGDHGYFTKIVSNLFIFIPLLTMGLISRETSSGSIKLAYSSPVTSTQFVLGKYLAALCVGTCLLIVPCASVIIGACTIVHFDILPLLVALLGLFLLIAVYCAIGLYMSSLTSYQVVAAVSTLAVLALFSNIGRFGMEYDFVRDITYWLSMSGRTASFMSGVFRSDDFCYFITMTGLFVTLTIFRIDFPRKSMKVWDKCARYAILALAVFCLAFTSSRPKLTGIADATRNRSNSITESSKEVIRRIDGKIVINNYINLLDKMSFRYIPSKFYQGRSEFEQYKLAKPDIEEHRIFYYGMTAEVANNAKFAGKSEDELRDFYVMMYRANPNIFKSVHELEDSALVMSEGNVFVREIIGPDGKKSLLRNYYDPTAIPTEAEMTAAFAKLCAKMPAVGFLQGNGERSIISSNLDAYTDFSTETHSRYALMNQGFDIYALDACSPIPDSLNIVVAADPAMIYTEAQISILRDYLERGGNMLILAEYIHRDALQPLLAELGVKPSENQIAAPEGETGASLVLARPADRLKEYSTCFKNLDKAQALVSMPGCVALDTLEDSRGFARKAILQTKPDAWLESDFAGFRDDAVECGTDEARGSFTTAMALTRGNQKILVLGDADCFANSEMTIVREGLETSNFTLIQSAFRWLSDGQFPVEMDRKPFLDNDFRIASRHNRLVRGAVYLASALLALAAFLTLRRRRRA